MTALVMGCNRELSNKSILDIYLSVKRNMFVAQNFIRNLVNKYGKHPVFTDGGAWYPYACKFLKLRHHLHSAFEKSIIERTIQYIKDRIENFDDYFPCRKKRCKLNHVTNWFNVFVDSYNTSMAP